MSEYIDIADKDIHKGHRSRMKSKLKQYGPKIFDTYELLEMLLYYCVPYKDTNPIAKRLLMKFGSLDGVLSASAEELVTVDGIGAKGAEFIRSAGALLYAVEIEGLDVGKTFDDYKKVGEYLIKHFTDNSYKVCMLSFDNAMRLIGVNDISGVRFGSAAVKPKSFIDAALMRGASIAIIAHVNEHGPLFPTESDMATDWVLREALSDVGVIVAEHYVICGTRYVGMRKDLSLCASVSPQLERFYGSIPDGTEE